MSISVSRDDDGDGDDNGDRDGDGDRDTGSNYLSVLMLFSLLGIPSSFLTLPV